MAILTMRSGVLAHPEDTVLQHLTDITKKSGVINTLSDLLVVEPSGGGRNVDVGTGRCVVKKSTTNAYPIRVTATETKAIGANSSGNPRIDAVVIYVDKAATPGGSSIGEDVADIAIVEGTPSASPSAPNTSQIESSIGSSNPYLVLAHVDVANGASGISNSEITQVSNIVWMDTPSPTNTIEYSATIAPDYNDGKEHTCLLTGNVTVTAPANMDIDKWFMLKLTQDGTGTRTVTWFSTIIWLSPDYSINSTADSVSVFAFKKTGAATFEGYLVGKEY